MLQARQIRSALKGLGILLLTVGAAIGGGYLLAEFGPLLAAAGLVALVLALWMLQNIEIAYWAVIGVVCLLPFASFPFDIGFRPTFLDAALGMLFVVWALRWMTDSERSFTATGLGGPVLLFLLLTLTAFVLGLGHAPLTSYVIRHFAEILLSILLFFLVVNTVQDTGRLERLVRALISAPSPRRPWASSSTPSRTTGPSARSRHCGLWATRLGPGFCGTSRTTRPCPSGPLPHPWTPTFWAVC